MCYWVKYQDYACPYPRCTGIVPGDEVPVRCLRIMSEGGRWGECGNVLGRLGTQPPTPASKRTNRDCGVCGEAARDKIAMVEAWVERTAAETARARMVMGRNGRAEARTETEEEEEEEEEEKGGKGQQAQQQQQPAKEEEVIEKQELVDG